MTTDETAKKAKEEAMEYDNYPDDERIDIAQKPLLDIIEQQKKEIDNKDLIILGLRNLIEELRKDYLEMIELNKALKNNTANSVEECQMTTDETMYLVMIECKQCHKPILCDYKTKEVRNCSEHQ